jgi:FkbM family methyltransferase
MGIMDKITARENLFLKEVEQAIESGYDTYLYGDGWCSRQAQVLIEKNTKLKIAGKLTDRAFLGNPDSICMEDFFDNLDGKINVIPVYHKYKDSDLTKYKDKINLLIYRDCYERNSDIDDIIRGYDYYKDASEAIDRLYNNVADEKSKQTLEAYINQQISMELGYISKIMGQNQYFDEEIITIGKNEVFVDCGAYTGDSAAEFAEFSNNRVGGYKKIISFEPDSGNYEKLKARNVPNNICINKGVSDKKGTVYFHSDFNISRVCDEGSEKIELDTIDNVVGDGNVTFIKMDIEGSELAALHGAKETIKRCRPKLAICIYHKPEDMWEIPDYISELVPDYKFYVRIYRYSTSELVLYAI